MKLAKLTVSIVSLFLVPLQLFAMTSANYSIVTDSSNSGGTENSSDGSSLISDSLGEVGTGFSSSPNYFLYAGYRVPEDSSTTSTPTNGGGTVYTSGSSPFQIIYVSATSGMTYANIHFDTTMSSVGNIKYGQTFQYENGIIDIAVSSTSHDITLENLIPNKKYLFFISASNGQSFYASYSGSFMTAQIPEIVKEPTVPVVSTSTEEVGSGSSTSTNEIGTATTTKFSNLSIKNIIFSQDNEVLDNSSSTIILYLNKDLKVTVDTNRLNLDISKIVLTINSTTTERFTLSSDESKKIFQAIVAGHFNLEGDYPFSVTFYDSENRVLGQVNGNFLVKKRLLDFLSFATLISFMISNNYIIIFWIVILLLIIWYFVWKRRKSKKVNDSDLFFK